MLRRHIEFGIALLFAVSPLPLGCGGERTEASRPWGATDSALTIFGAAVPSLPAANDALGVELGVKFRTSVPGQVLGVRFYRGVEATSDYRGTLWSVAGQRLARARLSPGSKAAGWRELLFTTPVEVSPSTTYVASYYAPQGRYDSVASAGISWLPPPDGERGAWISSNG